MAVTTRPAYYVTCDFCGETWGPYEDIGEAEFQPTCDGWLVTDQKILCYACQDTEEEEQEGNDES